MLVSSAWRSRCFRHDVLPLLLLLFICFCGLSLLAQDSDSSLGTSSLGTSTVGSATRGTVSGQVLNASTGLPVPRALVRFNDRAVLTDHEGKFEFDQLTEDSGNLQVIKPGYSSSTDLSEAGGENVRVSQIAAPLRVRLYPEALLTGTLTAPDGDPLPRIQVSALRSVFDDNNHRWTPAAQVLTDSHGNFRIPVPAGDYRLETRYTPRSHATSKAILPVIVPNDSSSNTSDVIRIHSGEEQHFDLRPATSQTHAVMVMVESGAERGFPTINAQAANGATLQINPTRTSPGGAYRMDLPSGTYTLAADMNGPEGFEEAETTVTVTDHDVSGVVLRFSPVPPLPAELVIDQAATSDNTKPTLLQLGLILQNNQPDSGRGDYAAIHLSPQRDHGLAFIVPPGSYRFQARNNGEWYIKSASYGSSDLLQQDLMVAPSSGGTPIRVTVSNQTGSLQGTVNLNGEAAACWIYLVATTPSANPVLRMRSNADGAYTFAYLAPGSYQAIAFEYRHSADYRDPASLAPYSTHVRSISIQAGDAQTLDLDAVSAAELVP
jgi:hypothetical protein